LTGPIQLDGNRVDGFVGLANRVGRKDQSSMSIFNSIYHYAIINDTF
jgi:hypothetical protein